jgi:hypothetical protein
MKYLLTTIIIFCVVLLFGVKKCQNIRDDRDRLSDNQRALLDKVIYYRSKDSLSVASVEKLTFTKNELEKHNVELVKTINDLNIKVNRLQSVSKTATQTEYNFRSTVKDSVVENRNYESAAWKDKLRTAADNAAIAADSVLFDTLHCLDYSDKWLTLSGCERNKIFSGRIESRDTLITIIHRIPKKWLFFRWGTKAIRQEVISKNPHSQIIYTEFIELKK